MNSAKHSRSRCRTIAQSGPRPQEPPRPAVPRQAACCEYEQRQSQQWMGCPPERRRPSDDRGG